MECKTTYVENSSHEFEFKKSHSFDDKIWRKRRRKTIGWDTYLFLINFSIMFFNAKKKINLILYHNFKYKHNSKKYPLENA